MISFTPSVLFFTIDQLKTSITILFFFSMVWTMFFVHFKVPPHIFIVSGAYIVASCCYAKKCVVCIIKHEDSFVAEFLVKKGCRILFEKLVLTPCNHVIDKNCLKKHLQGATTCPIDGQALSDDWIAENFWKLKRVAPGPAVPNKIDAAAEVVNFAKAAEAAENIEKV